MVRHNIGDTNVTINIELKLNKNGIKRNKFFFWLNWINEHKIGGKSQFGWDDHGTECVECKREWGRERESNQG